MLKIESSLLVVIDVQGKLAKLMHDGHYLRHVQGMMKAAKMLDIPIVMTEQAPEKIGATIEEIRALAPDVRPIAKQTFSSCGEPAFMDAVKRLRRKQIIVHSSFASTMDHLNRILGVTFGQKQQEAISICRTPEEIKSLVVGK